MMTPEEMEMHIKHLEFIIMNLMAQRNQSIGGICVNQSIHSHRISGTGSEWKEHPSGLQVPHYAWEPQIDWGRDIIHLHPENKRA